MTLFRRPWPDVEPTLKVYDVGPHMAGVTLAEIWKYFLAAGLYDDGTPTNAIQFLFLRKITATNPTFTYRFNLKSPFSHSILKSSLLAKTFILVSLIHFTVKHPPKSSYYHRRRIRLKLLARHYLPRFHSLTKHHTTFHPPHCQTKLTPQNEHFLFRLFIPRLFVKPIRFPKTPSIHNLLRHRPSLSSAPPPPLTTPQIHRYKNHFDPVYFNPPTPVLLRPIKMILYGFSAPLRYPREGVG